MNYSIFHSSHCGSTLLAFKLSKSIETYIEPQWTQIYHKLPVSTKPYVEQTTKENCLVKYPSHCPHIFRFIGGKKVFLYRKLKKHFDKFISKDGLTLDTPQIKNITERHFFHPHIDMKRFNGEDPKHILIMGWINRFLWMKNVKDVLYVDAEDFFANTEQVCNNICEHFNIEYVPVDINFYVKDYANKYSSESLPINIDEIPKETRKYNFISEIEEYDNDSLIKKVSLLHPELKEYLL